MKVVTPGVIDAATGKPPVLSLRDWEALTQKGKSRRGRDADDYLLEEFDTIIKILQVVNRRWQMLYGLSVRVMQSPRSSVQTTLGATDISSINETLS